MSDTPMRLSAEREQEIRGWTWAGDWDAEVGADLLAELDAIRAHLAQVEAALDRMRAYAMALRGDLVEVDICLDEDELDLMGEIIYRHMHGTLDQSVEALAAAPTTTYPDACCRGKEVCDHDTTPATAPPVGKRAMASNPADTQLINGLLADKADLLAQLAASERLAAARTVENERLRGFVSLIDTSEAAIGPLWALMCLMEGGDHDAQMQAYMTARESFQAWREAIVAYRAARAEAGGGGDA